MQVMVFKTSVNTAHGIRQLKPLLDSVAGSNQWNFDLDDCDRILRIVSVSLPAQCIIHMLTDNGYACAELED